MHGFHSHFPEAATKNLENPLIGGGSVGAGAGAGEAAAAALLESAVEGRLAFEEGRTAATLECTGTTAAVVVVVVVVVAVATVAGVAGVVGAAASLGRELEEPGRCFA